MASPRRRLRRRIIGFSCYMSSYMLFLLRAPVSGAAGGGHFGLMALTFKLRQQAGLCAGRRHVLVASPFDAQRVGLDMQDTGMNMKEVEPVWVGQVQ